MLSVDDHPYGQWDSVVFSESMYIECAKCSSDNQTEYEVVVYLNLVVLNGAKIFMFLSYTVLEIWT